MLNRDLNLPGCPWGTGRLFQHNLASPVGEIRRVRSGPKVKLALRAGGRRNEIVTERQALWMEHDLHASSELGVAAQHLSSIKKMSFQGLGPADLY